MKNTNLDVNFLNHKLCLQKNLDICLSSLCLTYMITTTNYSHLVEHRIQDH